MSRLQDTQKEEVLSEVRNKPNENFLEIKKA